MSKRRLLLADDSVTIQKVVNLTFADEGIDVMTVGDGDSAMSKLREFRPDVVLADVNMPGLTGYQVCEFIRSNEATKNLPVILLVGSFEPFDELEAGRVGANAYLTKPFQSIRQLVSQVNELMETSQHVDISAAETVEFETPIVDHAETDDIESLYHQSFPDMSEMMGKGEHGADFSDVGLDDEIIETSYAAGAAEREALDFDLAAAAESQLERVYDLEPEAEQALEELDKYETNRLVEQPPWPAAVPVQQQQPWPEKPAEIEQPAWQAETVNEPSPIFPNFEVERTQHPFEIVREPEIPVQEEPRPLSAFETFAEENTEPDSTTTEEHSFAGIAEETARFEAPMPEPYTPANEFDLLDILDIPSASSGEQLHFTTPQAADEAGSKKQVVSLSPELLELIVQRVVEKLSERY